MSAVLEALFAGQASPMPPDLMRDDFHLPGQHDQQSHAGGGGADPQLVADAAAIKALSPDDRDNRTVAEMPGGAKAYALYEGQKLAPKQEGKLKRVTDNNSFYLYQDYDAIIKVDDRVYGVSKYDDPDAGDDNTDDAGNVKQFVYAYEPLDAPIGKLIETQSAAVSDLVEHIRGKREFSRSDFHLQGQHDQQSHAGGGGARLRGDNEELTLQVEGPGRQEIEAPVIKNPDAEGLYAWLKRDNPTVRALLNERTGDLFVWRDLKLAHADMAASVRAAGEAREADEFKEYEHAAQWLLGKLNAEREGRWSFHLPGGHDQQSHGSEGGARHRRDDKTRNLTLRVKVGGYITVQGGKPSKLVDIDVLKNPTPDGLRRWMGRDVEYLRGFYDLKLGSVYLWDADSTSNHGMMWDSLVKLGEYKDSDDNDTRVMSIGGTRKDVLAQIRDYRKNPDPEDWFSRNHFHLPGGHDQEDHGNRAGAPQEKRGTGRMRPNWAMTKARATEIAEEIGIKKFAVRSIPDGEIGGLHAMVLGHYNPKTREIVLNTKALVFSTESEIRGTLRHEYGHAQMDAAFRARSSGVREFVNAPRNLKALERDDGTTAYSRQFWRDYNHAAKTLDAKDSIDRLLLNNYWSNAMNESYAEMRRLGKFKGAYERLDKLVKAHHGE